MTQTTVRYLPRSGLVWVRGEGMTITFRVNAVNEINTRLASLGYYSVRDWHEDNGQLQGRTSRAGARAAA